MTQFSRFRFTWDQLNEWFWVWSKQIRNLEKEADGFLLALFQNLTVFVLEEIQHGKGLGVDITSTRKIQQAFPLSADFCRHDVKKHTVYFYFYSVVSK